MSKYNRSLTEVVGFNNNQQKWGNNVNVKNQSGNEQIQGKQHQEEIQKEAHVQPSEMVPETAQTTSEGDKLDGAIDELKSMIEEKKKKKTQEDTPTRATFMVNNELLKRLDRLSKNQRGFKTLFINKAIETLLNELEK